jgi:hypothetical protein
MTLDELLALHTDEDADINREALKQALATELESYSIDELDRIRFKAHPESLIPQEYPVPLPTLRDFVQKDSLIIHGRVTDVDISREELIQQVLDRQVLPVDIRISLQVLGEYPETLESDVLTYTITQRSVYVVDADHEYVFAFTQIGEKLHGGFFPYIKSVDDGEVWGAAGSASLPVAAMWKLAAGYYAVATGQAPVDAQSLAPWLEMLRSDSLVDVLVAMKYLECQPDLIIDSITITDALASHYELLRPRIKDDYDPSLANPTCRYRELARSGISILTRLREPESVRKVYGLYVGDVSENCVPMMPPDEFGLPVLELVASVPGIERIERIGTLFKATGYVTCSRGGSSYFLLQHNKFDEIRALKEIEGDDIDALLWEMFENPELFNIRDLEFGLVKSAIEERQEARKT